jgi:hypothetical protein
MTLIHTLVVIPAKAGIHKHRAVIMDSGFRRNDNQSLFKSSLTLKQR